MSIVARVFVVLNLIISVVFIVFALTFWTAKTKWEVMYERERKANIERKFDAQPRLAQLSETAVRNEELYKRQIDKITELRTLLSNLGDQLVKAQGDLAKAKGEADVAREESKIKGEELTALQGRIQNLNNVILAQQKAVEVAMKNEAKMRAERIEMENDANQAKQQLGQLQKDLRSLEEQNEAMSRRIEDWILRGVLNTEALAGDKELPQKPLPLAKVLAVKPDLDMVVISIGRSVGVEPGYRFTVSRGDKYVAKAQAEKVYDEMSLCRLMQKKEDVQLYDDVRSKLSPK